MQEHDEQLRSARHRDGLLRRNLLEISRAVNFEAGTFVYLEVGGTCTGLRPTVQRQNSIVMTMDPFRACVFVVADPSHAATLAVRWALTLRGGLACTHAYFISHGRRSTAVTYTEPRVRRDLWLSKQFKHAAPELYAMFVATTREAGSPWREISFETFGRRPGGWGTIGLVTARQQKALPHDVKEIMTADGCANKFIHAERSVIGACGH